MPKQNAMLAILNAMSNNRRRFRARKKSEHQIDPGTWWLNPPGTTGNEGFKGHMLLILGEQ
jgi:hypothetical protein